MQQVLSSVCPMNNHMLLNLFFPHLQNGDHDGDKSTPETGCQYLRATKPPSIFTPTLMHAKTETSGNQARTLRLL